MHSEQGVECYGGGAVQKERWLTGDLDCSVLRVHACTSASLQHLLCLFPPPSASFLHLLHLFAHLLPSPLSSGPRSCVNVRHERQTERNTGRRMSAPSRRCWPNTERQGADLSIHRLLLFPISRVFSKLQSPDHVRSIIRHARVTTISKRRLGVLPLDAVGASVGRSKGMPLTLLNLAREGLPRVC